MAKGVGILAYGSLFGEPGAEIADATLETITGVTTPFEVEFARSSERRAGAPTLVPVRQGGAQVQALIFVVNVPEKEAADRLYRREINQVGRKERTYKAPKTVGPDTVVVGRLENFAGIGVVLYTQITANIEPLTAEILAIRAIKSARAPGNLRDGISYLMDAKRYGIRTMMSDAYEQEIKRQTGATDLAAARAMARAQGRDAAFHTIRVLASVIWNIHLKRVVHAVDPKPRLNFWRLMYGNLLDMAVIEWCKLFGSDHEEHQPVHWKNMVPESDHHAFRQGLLEQQKMTADAWLEYWRQVKGYRDNHAAHFSAEWLRAENKPQYPELGPALEAAYYYYSELIGRLDAGGIAHRYPTDIREYCDRFAAQVKEAATRAVGATADMVEKVL